MCYRSAVEVFHLLVLNYFCVYGPHLVEVLPRRAGAGAGGFTAAGSPKPKPCRTGPGLAGPAVGRIRAAVDRSVSTSFQVKLRYEEQRVQVTSSTNTRTHAA